MASTLREMPEEALELPQGSLVLADLHLHPDDEPRLESLLAWASALAGVPRLVILGDLFDVWVGPAQARQRASGRVVEALAALAARGTRVEIVPGNRDFLLDAVFERLTGARLWPAGVLARVPGGASVLLIHGDELCTRDLAYQRMKRVLRSRIVRAVSRRSPHSVARWAAARGYGLARSRPSHGSSRRRRPCRPTRFERSRARAPARWSAVTRTAPATRYRRGRAGSCSTRGEGADLCRRRRTTGSLRSRHGAPRASLDPFRPGPTLSP
jgi:UDP-2,3-diacylglucosamine pyrophosphatase LpxH